MLAWLGRGSSIGRSLLVGGGGWFVVDGVASILAGAPLNIVGNLAFLALVVWAAGSRAAPSFFGQPSAYAGRQADRAEGRAD